jgi:hypothetical protein
MNELNSKKSLPMCIKENRGFMLFSRIIAVYSENHLKHMDTMLFTLCREMLSSLMLEWAVHTGTTVRSES